MNFETGQVTLGGIKAYTSEIGRCRRLLVIACASSYHAAVAVRSGVVWCGVAWCAGAG